MGRFTERNVIPEIIDDFNLGGDLLEGNLDEIEWINQYLGGTQTSVMPVLQYITQNQRQNIRVVDLGCGSGDLLKYLSTACKNRKDVSFTGVDANPNIVKYALDKHFRENEVEFIQADIFESPEKIPPADIYVMNLFLHHFVNDDIQKLLNQLYNLKPEMIIINDLHRSKLAYFLFNLVSAVIGFSAITRNDGRLSILKGFKRKELLQIIPDNAAYSFRLKWKWAFRWQLVISKININ